MLLVFRIFPHCLKISSVAPALKFFYVINMKGSLKIMAAVLVMLFCLSPLSAVDFNQDDANALNSTNTLNSSVDETNELDSNASKKYEKPESNIALQKSDCYLYIHVNNIYANQTEDIEIQCDPHYYGDIKIQIDDGEFIRANVSNGYGITRVGGLSYGFHTAKVICEETDSHTRSEASADFEVYSCDPHLNVKINDILIGDDAIIEVTTEASITDYVNVVVDDNRFVSMKINEGKGSTKISDLEPGNHTAKVSFKGNDIYHSSEQTVHFYVKGPSPKSDCCLNVAVDDIYVNQNAKIMISTDPHYQGHIKVQVDDGEFITVQLSNGHGSTTVSGLEAGPHTVKAIAEETDSYLASEASTDFEVKKAE